MQCTERKSTTNSAIIGSLQDLHLLFSKRVCVHCVCQELVNGTKIQWCMYMGSMNREWGKGRARKILVWNRGKTNYKIYKHLWYFSLYYMYFLCISSCHVLRGTVWSCVVEYFIVIILIFKWFFVFKFKLLICTLCIYNEVKVQLDDRQFVSWHNLLEQYFLDIPTEMNRMAWSCKSIFHVHV